MGLDSFWRMPTDEVRQGETNVRSTQDNHPQHPTFNPPLHLCGGMLSGSGEGSFRGKVYNELIERLNELIERLTGVSLYEETLPNNVIRMMADHLDSVVSVPTIYQIDQKTFDNLRRMFRAYVVIFTTKMPESWLCW